jgi:hypothetical protein
MKEIFKQCNYLPIGYLIGNLGNVKSPKDKILKKAKSNSGYECINIKNKGYFIHRAICFAFKQTLEGKCFVNHIDGNKLNNNIENLEWCTKSENTKHAYTKGLKQKSISNLYKGKFGLEHNRSKKVICIEDGNTFGSMSEAERFYKLGAGSVSWSVKNKKSIYKMHFEIKI